MLAKFQLVFSTRISDQNDLVQAGHSDLRARPKPGTLGFAGHINGWHVDRIRPTCVPAGPGFTVKRPIRKEGLAPLLHSRLILLLLASRIWRALHESVNFVHDPEKQYKSLSVAHRPGGSRFPKYG